MWTEPAPERRAGHSVCPLRGELLGLRDTHRVGEAFRQLAWILLFAALLALGVTVLRRQTAVEFPGAPLPPFRHGDGTGGLRP